MGIIHGAASSDSSLQPSSVQSSSSGLLPSLRNRNKRIYYDIHNKQLHSKELPREALFLCSPIREKRILPTIPPTFDVTFFNSMFYR